MKALNKKQIDQLAKQRFAVSDKSKFDMTQAVAHGVDNATAIKEAYMALKDSGYDPVTVTPYDKNGQRIGYIVTGPCATRKGLFFKSIAEKDLKDMFTALKNYQE